MSDRPRVVLEKSRTVRRRYQRSNKRFQFTASQIARIEREEEREHRAQKLRDKEKRRIADKKKRAEKEAKAREERLRLGLPDPNAPAVPASQPLLFKFIKNSPSVSAESREEKEEENTGSPGSQTTEIATEIGDEDWNLENVEMDTVMAALGNENLSTSGESLELCGKKEGGRTEEEDEFSDCSAFYDEDIIKNAEVDVGKQMSVPAGLLSGDSFHDDTAVLLEQFGHEFDPGASFDQELAQLGGV